MKKSLLILTALLAVSVANAQKLVIKGSDTLGAKLVPQLAEEFKAKNPGVSFEIAAEGSTTGITAIIDGTAEIGMASRRAKATEISLAKSKGVDMKPIVVAYDGIALVVNANNPLTSLSKSQIEKIFTGEVTDWSAVGGSAGAISVYTRNTSSGTYAVFKELAMHKRDYAPSSQKMAGNEQIVAEVAKNPNGIGYVGLAYIDVAGVKAVPVDGVLPSEASVKNKTYGLARPTFYYVNGTPGGIAAKFIDYTLSAEGQDMVRKVGFVPVK
ncbi:MAG TPA: phosphate ABC transporter substrate-binding protein [Rariglobus sp.]|jgi:phosphate transport system substrate-binding protein|nr:phosphate ABC transporter substrate-binding protein [Rariglobus sp.]